MQLYKVHLNNCGAADIFISYEAIAENQESAINQVLPEFMAEIEKEVKEDAWVETEPFDPDN